MHMEHGCKPKAHTTLSLTLTSRGVLGVWTMIGLARREDLFMWLHSDTVPNMTNSNCYRFVLHIVFRLEEVRNSHRHTYGGVENPFNKRQQQPILTMEGSSNTREKKMPVATNSHTFWLLYQFVANKILWNLSVRPKILHTNFHHEHLNARMNTLSVSLWLDGKIIRKL